MKRTLKPVFVSDELGALYQTGYKRLELAPPEMRHHLCEELSLVVAVSEHTARWLWPRSGLSAAAWHLPFGDNKQWQGPSDKLAYVIKGAAEALRRGDNVLVYCYYGVNRSGLIVTLIVRQYAGVSGAEALRLVRRSRKGSVGGNPHFVRYLESLGAP